MKIETFKLIDDLSNIHPVDITKEFQEVLNKKIVYIMEQREEIITAFIAKYGCAPDEIEQIEERYENLTKWYVRKRNETNS